MRASAAFLCGVLLAGCATTPDVNVAASSKSGYRLCESLVTSSKDLAVREAEARELGRRGDDCRSHLPAIQAAIQAGQVASATLEPAAPAAALLKRQYVSGANRICVYDRAGVLSIATPSVADGCPATL